MTFLLPAVWASWRHSASPASVFLSVKWDGYSFLTGCGEAERNEASKDPVARRAFWLWVCLPGPEPGARGPVWAGGQSLQARSAGLAPCGPGEKPAGRGRSEVAS